MIRFILGLVTALASFLGWLGFSESVVAAPTVDLSTEVSIKATQPVNLNQASSLWQLSNQDSQEFFAHLGCNCAACAGVVEQAREI